MNKLKLIILSLGLIGKYFGCREDEFRLPPIKPRTYQKLAKLFNCRNNVKPAIIELLANPLGPIKPMELEEFVIGTKTSHMHDNIHRSIVKNSNELEHFIQVNCPGPYNPYWFAAIIYDSKWRAANGVSADLSDFFNYMSQFDETKRPYPLTFIYWDGNSYCKVKVRNWPQAQALIKLISESLGVTEAQIDTANIDIPDFHSQASQVMDEDPCWSDNSDGNSVRSEASSVAQDTEVSYTTNCHSETDSVKIVWAATRSGASSPYDNLTPRMPVHETALVQGPNQKIPNFADKSASAATYRIVLKDPNEYNSVKIVWGDQRSGPSSLNNLTSFRSVKKPPLVQTPNVPQDKTSAQSSHSNLFPEQNIEKIKITLEGNEMKFPMIVKHCPNGYMGMSAAVGLCFGNYGFFKPIYSLSELDDLYNFIQNNPIHYPYGFFIAVYDKVCDEHLIPRDDINTLLKTIEELNYYGLLTHPKHILFKSENSKGVNVYYRLHTDTSTRALEFYNKLCAVTISPALENIENNYTLDYCQTSSASSQWNVESRSKSTGISSKKVRSNGKKHYRDSWNWWNNGWNQRGHDW